MEEIKGTEFGFDLFNLKLTEFILTPNYTAAHFIFRLTVKLIIQ